MPERGSCYLWCPAYPLADATAAQEAEATAARFATAADLDLARSPLLACSPGPGIWPARDERLADLTAGCHHTWLLAARGGYGCVDLLADLPPTLPRIIGYSDLTVLHAAQAARGGPGGLYGFMPGVRHGTQAFASAVALARGAGWEIHDGAETRPLHAGTAHGPLFAGCLRVLTGLVGTPWMPKLHGRILALEDIDEKPYQVDRDLFQLAQAGCLSGIIGLIFGRFPAPLAAGYAGPSTATIAGQWAARLDVPAVFGLPIGHDPDPVTLAIDRPSTLTVTTSGWTFNQLPDPG